MNGDDDNENGVRDWAEMGTAVPKENDLIEVKIDRLPGAGNLALSAGSSLQLWQNYNRTGPISNGQALNFVDEATVFVEWVDVNHGLATLTLIDQATQTPLDSLRFHSFRSMVVIFGGNGQNPRDTDRDGRLGDPRNAAGTNREGIFDFASELYVTGWDVYAYDEEVDLNIPFTEVLTQRVQYRHYKMPTKHCSAYYAVLWWQMAAHPP